MITWTRLGFLQYSFHQHLLVEQIVSVRAEAVADIVKERPTKTIFWDYAYNNWGETEFKEHLRGQRNISIDTK